VPDTIAVQPSFSWFYLLLKEIRKRTGDERRKKVKERQSEWTPGAEST
jgi:hypothetical protein